MIIKTIISSIKQSSRFPRINLFILIIQLLLSSLIGVLAYNYIQCSIGDSTNLLKIIDGYDHDVLQDLLRFEGTGWTMIKSFSYLVTFLYLLVGPFVMGGLLHAFDKEADRWDIFWKGGSRYYLRFLGINLIILFIVAVIGGLAGFASITIITKGLEYFISEIPPLWMLLGVALLLILIIILLVSISTIAKWYIITQNKSIRRSLKESSKYVISRFWYYISLGVIFLIISLGFALVLNMVINGIKESNFLLVVLALTIQLLALYLRVWLRNGYYASILSK